MVWELTFLNQINKNDKSLVFVKSFAQFLGEAVKTAASTQAKQRGLVGDGHGAIKHEATLVKRVIECLLGARRALPDAHIDGAGRIGEEHVATFVGGAVGH